MSFQYFIRATNHIRLVTFDVDLHHRDVVHVPQQIVQSRPLHLDANACPPTIFEGSNGLFRIARPVEQESEAPSFRWHSTRLGCGHPHPLPMCCF